MVKAISHDKQVKVAMAIADMKSGKFSLRKAAAFYGLKRSTISDYKCKKKNLNFVNFVGGKTLFSYEEEQEFINVMEDAVKRSLVISKVSLIKYCKEILREEMRTNNTRWIHWRTKKAFINNKNNLLGKGWYQGFLRRNNLLGKVPLTNCDITEISIRNWFTDLYQYCVDNNLVEVLNDPEKLFNMDETGAKLCGNLDRVVAIKDWSNLHLKEVTNENPTITVLVTVQASGKLAPNCVVLPSSKLATSFKKEILLNCNYSTSSGCANCDVLFDYLVNIFHPWLIYMKIKLPVIIFANWHVDRLNFLLIMKLKEMGIVLYGFPSNATHLLQPLNVDCSSVLKVEWSKALKKMSKPNITKSNFNSIFLPTLATSLTPNLITTRFRKVGLFPFDPNAPNYSDLPKKYSNRPISSLDDMHKNQLFFERCNILDKTIQVGAECEFDLNRPLSRENQKTLSGINLQDNYSNSLPSTDSEPCSNIASHSECISEQPTLPYPPDSVHQEKLFIVKSSDQQEQPFEKSLLNLDFESGQVTNLSGSPPNDVVSFIKQIMNAVYCELLKVIKKEDTYKGEHILKCFLSVIQVMTLQYLKKRSEYGFRSNGSSNSNDSSNNNEMPVETHSLHQEEELLFPRRQNDVSNDDLDNSALSKETKSNATNALPQEMLFLEMSNFVDNEKADDNVTYFEKEQVSNVEKSYFKVEEEAFELSECSDEYKSLAITSIPGKCISNESIFCRNGNSNNLVKFLRNVEEKNHSIGSNIFDNSNTEPILQNVDTFVEYLDLKSEGNCSLYCSVCNQSLTDQELHNCANFDNCIKSNQSNVKTLRKVTTNNSSLKKKFCLKLKENSADLKLSKSPSLVIDKSLCCKLRKDAATKIIYDSGFSFKCSECNFIGQKLNLLFKHVATTHFLKNFKKFGNIDDKDPACKVNVQCPACSNTYVHLSYLFQHISIVHKKVKPFNCNICNESYSQKYQLSKHYIQHAIQS